MLSTWDIIAENFGFMLAWGDIVYVPFLYSIAGWFIINQTEAINIYIIVLLIVTFIISLWIFRSSNIQKYRFKKNPNTKIWFKKAKTLEGKILISGFWGIGRKLNYSGEILTYLIMTFTAGFVSYILIQVYINKVIIKIILLLSNFLKKNQKLNFFILKKYGK